MQDPIKYLSELQANDTHAQQQQQPLTGDKKHQVFQCSEGGRQGTESAPVRDFIVLSWHQGRP